MLRAIGLKNFKSFDSLEPQPVSGLTLLAGNNSCGKSTVLQAILLLKQSLENQDRSALNMNGRLVRLGAFGEVVSGKRRSARITYTLEVDGADCLELEYARRGQDEPGSFLYRVCAKIEGARIDIAQPRYQPVVTLASGSKIQFQYKACLDSAALGDPLVEAIPTASTQRHLAEEDEPEPAAARARDLLVQLVKVLIDLKEWLVTRVHYLGPVRVSPERFYMVEDVPELGPLGENTVAVLSRRRAESITTTSPPTGTNHLRRPLGAYTERWMKALGFRYDMAPTVDDSNILYQLDLKLVGFSRGRNVSPRDVGYGLSQLLPIVVGGLIASPGDLMLLEQPEIHLHPAVQSKLGDFLISMARVGKHVLAETHSEHLVTRLRRRVAEDEGGALCEIIRVLFVEQDPSGWRSHVRPLQFDRVGGLVDWPEGFFDHSVDEFRAISEAAMKKLRPRKGAR